MKKVADTSLSNLGTNPQWLLGALGIGAAGAVGMRSAKNLWDMYKDQDSSNSVEKFVPSQTANRAKIPVQVSPEEAQELARQGVNVKAAGAKLALSPTFLDNFMLGGAAVGGAALGWKAVDGMYDNQRLGLQQQKLDAAKKRVKSLLSGEPQQGDAVLGTALKTAEDHIMKTAWTNPLADLGRLGVGLVNGLPSALPLAAGGGAALIAASAFNESRKRNKALNSSKAIADYARSMPTQAPVAELEPVLAKTAGKEVSEYWKNRLATMKERRGEKVPDAKTAALKSVLGAAHARVS